MKTGGSIPGGGTPRAPASAGSSRRYAGDGRFLPARVRQISGTISGMHIRRRKGKRGVSYAVEVDLRGVTKHATFDTRAQAIEWGADIERRIRAGQGITVAGRTLEDAFLRFIEQECPHRTRGAWEATRLLYYCRVPIAKVRLEDLTAERIDQWQKARLREVSTETVRRDRALFSAVMAKAVKVWRWLPASPFADVPLPPEGAGRTRLATDDEIARILHVAGTDLRYVQARVAAAFALACETGMRGGEIIALRRRDLHLRQSYVHVAQSKNGDARDVALSPRAAVILERVAERGADPVFELNARQKDAVFRKIRARAGITGLAFHDSRHTACTALSKRLHVLELARQLGMRDLKTLMVYYNAPATELAQKLK